ncbi:unnamed protein product [Choristocarpus tenellus]
MKAKGEKAEEKAKVMTSATLRVTDYITSAQRPVEYVAEFTRGGWIWRTSHRYRDWLALKDEIQTEFGTRHLPPKSLFPEKQNMGDILVNVIESCQGCRADCGPLGLLEERRRGLQVSSKKFL